MAYEALPGHGVVFVFLSSFREMAVHDCTPTDSHEEMLSANSRKCSHLPSVFSSEKYPLPMRTLYFALQCSLSLGALLSMCFIPRFLFFTLSQLRRLRVKALKLTYLGPNPSSACHKLCGPCFDFLIYTLRMSVAPASECWEDQMGG